MAEAETEKSLPENAVPEENVKKKFVVPDPEFYSCMLQSSHSDSDPNYIGIRRLLLYRKAVSGVLRRKVRFIFKALLRTNYISLKVLFRSFYFHWNVLYYYRLGLFSLECDILLTSRSKLKIICSKNEKFSSNCRFYFAHFTTI